MRPFTCYKSGTSYIPTNPLAVLRACALHTKPVFLLYPATPSTPSVRPYCFFVLFIDTSPVFKKHETDETIMTGNIVLLSYTTLLANGIIFPGIPGQIGIISGKIHPMPNVLGTKSRSLTKQTTSQRSFLGKHRFLKLTRRPRTV